MKSTAVQYRYVVDALRTSNLPNHASAQYHTVVSITQGARIPYSVQAYCR